jgi:hypothetical protein
LDAFLHFTERGAFGFDAPHQGEGDVAVFVNDNIVSLNLAAATGFEAHLQLIANAQTRFPS